MKKIILFVGVLILFIVGCVPQEAVICPECKECLDCEENTFGQIALIDAQIYQSGVNELDTDEFFWEFWIMNYGEFEATNIKVKCDVVDEEGNELISKVEDIGNLASQSVEFRGIYISMTQKFKNLDEDLLIVPICFVDECDNCDILYKRIPDLVESYEGI